MGGDVRGPWSGDAAFLRDSGPVDLRLLERTGQTVGAVKVPCHLPST